MANVCSSAVPRKGACKYAGNRSSVCARPEQLGSKIIIPIARGCPLFEDDITGVIDLGIASSALVAASCEDNLVENSEWQWRTPTRRIP